MTWLQFQSLPQNPFNIMLSGAETGTGQYKRQGIQRKAIQVSEGKNKHVKWLHYLTFTELEYVKHETFQQMKLFLSQTLILFFFI